VENSKAKICETNLKVQQASLDIYAMEHDSMPASLSLIPDQCLRRAYAKVLSEKGAWKIKLAHWIVDISERNFAFASFLSDEIVRGHKSSLICPKDPNPAMHGGVSYGLNSRLAGMSSRVYRNLSDQAVLIADCDTTTFSETDVGTLAKRHIKHKILRQENFAQGVSRGKVVSKYNYSYPIISQQAGQVTSPPSTGTPTYGQTTACVSLAEQLFYCETDHQCAPGSTKSGGCKDCDTQYSNYISAGCI
jgi:hypothetical protein